MDDGAVQLYVDESIHEGLGAIVVAFVFSKADLGPLVAAALGDAGLRPGVDECKSGARMEGNPAMQQARDALLVIAGSKCRNALALLPLVDRPQLGHRCLEMLGKIIQRNGFGAVPFEAHFDEGIFSRPGKAEKVLARKASLQRVKVQASVDSRHCLGVQVADAVANATGQVLREAVTGQPKMLDIGGANTGYEAGTHAPLGWSLKMALRYSLLRRPVILEGGEKDPDVRPLMARSISEAIDAGQNPEVLGWGLLLGEGLPAEVRSAAVEVLGRIWLGCIH